MNKLSSVVRFILISAAFVVLVAGMRAAESLLVPFLLSVFIALIFSPVLLWLKSRRVPNALAIVIIIMFVIALGILTGAVVGASVKDFRNDLPDYQLRLQGMSEAILGWLAGKGIEVDAAQWRQTVNPGLIMKLAGNMLSSFGNVMTNAFLILLTVIFILAEEVGFREKLIQARGDSPESMLALDKFTSSVNRYLGIKTMLSLLTGVLVAVMLWLLGVEYPLMWGMLAFMLNYVPTVGSLLAAVPAILLALLQVSPFMVVIVVLGYLAINLLVGNVLEPRLMGKGLNLSPLVVFLSLIFWGWVLGPVGMLLSIPLTILVKIGLESDPDSRWLGIMLGAGQRPDSTKPAVAPDLSD